MDDKNIRVFPFRNETKRRGTYSLDLFDWSAPEISRVGIIHQFYQESSNN